MDVFYKSGRTIEKTIRRGLCFLVILTLLFINACGGLNLNSPADSKSSSMPTTDVSPVPENSASSLPSVSTPGVTGGDFILPPSSSSLVSTPYKPSGELAELFEYMLNLINTDRNNAGLEPVELGFNGAAQQHAQDMFDHYYISHWDTKGLKPYMRYTILGGYNYEQENSAYSGWYNMADNPDRYVSIDPKEELANLEWSMMNDDAASNWGHRDNILNPWHKKVNLGIAYDSKRLALVQQFEGDYIEFSQPPVISGGQLFLSGRYYLGKINNISVSFDKSPVTLTPAELLAGPHSYGPGDRLGYIIPPPPPGQYYVNLPENAVQARKWVEGADGRFNIQADIGSFLERGKGVYTFYVVVKVGNEPLNLTNYSVFIE